jgi:uncharacterized protein YdeI (YjbR/CyaY-like superfamily)
MKMTGQPIAFATVVEWRAWLEASHATAEDVWLMIYKKHTETPSVALQQAMEEAICFGWIDSSMQPIRAIRHLKIEMGTPQGWRTNGALA